VAAAAAVAMLSPAEVAVRRAAARAGVLASEVTIDAAEAMLAAMPSLPEPQTLKKYAGDYRLNPMSVASLDDVLGPVRSMN